MEQETKNRHAGSTRESDTIQFVRCPFCAAEQADMGAHVACEECGEGPMPYFDAAGELVEP